MRCSFPQQRVIDGVKVSYPCGHCNSCLNNRRTEKALRGYLESLSHKSSVFLTLTYNDDNVPKNKNGVMTLSKASFDNFIKRLRSWSDVSFRVLASGEYSPTGRPHYHCCLFGIDIDTFIKGTPHYHSNSYGQVLEDFCCWKFGGCEIANFDIKTSFYVSKYLVKSQKDKKEYEELGIEPEFIYQSRRPALGKKYCEEHRARLLKDGFIRCKGRKYPIPRYFVEKILKDDSSEYADYKARSLGLAFKHYTKYIKGLNKQFKGSPLHFYDRRNAEAEARDKLIEKGK